MDFEKLQKIVIKLEEAMRDILREQHIDPRNMKLSFIVDSLTGEPIVKINDKELPRDIMKEFTNELTRIFEEKDEDDLFSMFKQTQHAPFDNIFHDLKLSRIKPSTYRYKGFRDGLEHFNKPLQNRVNFDAHEKEYMRDVFEDDDSVHFIVELPSGTKKEDIDIKAHENEVSVQGIIIKSPCKIVPDKSKASFRNGILELVFKKK